MKFLFRARLLSAFLLLLFFSGSTCFHAGEERSESDDECTNIKEESACKNNATCEWDPVEKCRKKSALTQGSYFLLTFKPRLTSAQFAGGFTHDINRVGTNGDRSLLYFHDGIGPSQVGFFGER